MRVIEKGIWRMEGVLSGESCAALVSLAEEAGFKEARLRHRGRRNQEAFVECAATRQALLDAVCRYVSQAPENNFHIVGVSNVLEFYKYSDGEAIAPHADSAVQVKPDLTSNLTVVIYLSDRFEGGDTFFPERGVRSHAKAGDALLFEHDLIHEATPVVAGTQYIFRTSVAAAFHC